MGPVPSPQIDGSQPKAEDPRGNSRLGDTDNAELRAQLATIETRLMTAEEERTVSVAQAFAERRRMAEGHIGDTSQAMAALESKVKELQGQLARAEGSQEALHDAASRAAERLQAQALKERDLEARLA